MNPTVLILLFLQPFEHDWKIGRVPMRNRSFEETQFLYAERLQSKGVHHRIAGNTRGGAAHVY